MDHGLEETEGDPRGTPFCTAIKSGRGLGRESDPDTQSGKVGLKGQRGGTSKMTHFRVLLSWDLIGPCARVEAGKTWLGGFRSRSVN